MIWSVFFFFFFFFFKSFFFFSEVVSLDSFSIFLLCIFPLLFNLINMCNSNFSNNESMYTFKSFYIAIFILLILCFSSENLFLFLVSLECCVYFMLKLIINFSKDMDKISSSFFMFFTNILGSIPFMIPLSICLSTLSTFDSCLHFPTHLSSNIMFFCFIFMLCTKIPVFLLHFWLTKAHVSASGSTSMLLASLMLKIGSFGLFKFATAFKLLKSPVLNNFISFNIIGCMFLVWVMIRFFDMKYLIACSSILHMSISLCLVISASPVSLLSSMLMSVGHGLVSYFLFYLVSLVYESSVNRSYDFNKSMESLSSSFSMWFILYLVMNLGFPPLINFLSEFLSCNFFLFYCSSSFLLFGLSLFMGVFFFILIVLKLLFGKKLLFYDQSTHTIMNMHSFSFFSFLIFCPLLFF